MERSDAISSPTAGTHNTRSRKFRYPPLCRLLIAPRQASRGAVIDHIRLTIRSSDRWSYVALRWSVGSLLWSVIRRHRDASTAVDAVTSPTSTNISNARGCDGYSTWSADKRARDSHSQLDTWSAVVPRVAGGYDAAERSSEGLWDNDTGSVGFVKRVMSREQI